MVWLKTLCLLSTLHLAISMDYLPDDVMPTHYDVRLVYDVDPNTNFSFYGVVDILIKAKKQTSKIILHAEDLVIMNQIKVSREDENVPIINIAVKEQYSMLTISLAKQMEKDQIYNVNIPFYGYLKPAFDGVYVSSYVNKKTKEREYLIVTQFEPLEARKGFPCFDEPIYKATFRISIGHHKSYTSVSNMPLNKTTNHNNLEPDWPWQTIETTFKKPQSDFVFDEFDISVPMSTYLVAFVVSKFTYRESPAGLSTAKFKIWSRSDAADQTAYASNIGPKVLTHFEKWFNVTYPLPKLDMIAIPDFATGGMENWGLITYSEITLLFDKESPFLVKEVTAETIAHELAHQWFGNLVTMKWWSDLWLNEGFATFVASIGVAAAEPTWNADKSYAVNNILAVLSLDALESSHPVSVPINDPKTIFEIFDTISYKKGATIVRMMTMFLGEEVFRQGIHNYLVKYSYQNADQDDLWQMLTEVSQQYGGLTRNVTIKQVMDTWTTQTGYPLLTVTRHYNDSTLTITQKRYISLNALARTTASWWVPLTVKTEMDRVTKPLQWLARNEGIAHPYRYIHNAKNDQWLMFNYDMIAPYRVNYDGQNWKLLSITLHSSRYTEIPILGRVQLLSDAFALAWTNHMGYDTTLELTSYLSRETDFLPLSTGLAGLQNIRSALRRSPDYGVFQKYVRMLIGDTYQKSGGMASQSIFNGDNLERVKMQVMLGTWACTAKVPGCEENAIMMFQKWMDTKNPDDHNPIPLDLRYIVYSVAIERGSETHWNFALARRQRANSAATQTHLLLALCNTRVLWVISQLLEWSITDGSEIRRHDTATAITGVLKSTVGYYIAKDFVYDRIQDIHKALGGNGFFLGEIIAVLIGQFTTQKELNEFIAWRKKNCKLLEGSKLRVDQAVERMKVNINWINRNRRLVVDKLGEFSVDVKEPYMKAKEGLISFQARTQVINFQILFVTITFINIV